MHAGLTKSTLVLQLVPMLAVETVGSLAINSVCIAARCSRLVLLHCGLPLTSANCANNKVLKSLLSVDAHEHYFF